MFTKHINSLLPLSLLTITLFSCTGGDDGSTQNNAPSAMEVAEATEALSLFVAAIEKADENDGSTLASLLRANGTYTVIAPNNEAFERLFYSLEGITDLDDFDTTEEREILAQILKLHVSSGAVLESDDFMDGQQINTLQEERIEVSLSNGVAFNDLNANTAKVATADLEASNGVLHTLDEVLVPQETQLALGNNGDQGGAVYVLANAPELSTLYEAVQKTGLQNTFDVQPDQSARSVFAPTNAAFEAFFSASTDYDSLDDFTSEADLALLSDILKYHVVTVGLSPEQRVNGATFDTVLEGQSIRFLLSGTEESVQDATGEIANVLVSSIGTASGSVVYVDKVLSPMTN